MKSVTVKLGLSAAIIVLILAALPFVGVTEQEHEEVQGMVVDFGYWDVVWTEMDLTDEMDGYVALDILCGIRDYDYTILEDGSVYTINDQSNLIGATWGFYTLSEGRWVEKDPSDKGLAGDSIICWARASGADTVMPGADQMGHSYYSYADDGKSLRTGKDLRIVSLAPSVTETLCAVGGLGYIIGTDLYSNYPQEVVDRKEDGTISVIGGYIDPNYEWIVRLAPDLVFCDGGTGEHTAIADKLRKSGIECVVLWGSTDIGTLYDNIWMTASALGKSENANQLINDLQDSVDNVSGIAGETFKRTFVALSADPSPWTSGSDTFMSDVIYSAGGINIFDSQSSSWFMVSKEQIYKKQPRVIVVISSSIVSTQEEYDAVLESLDPLWKSTPAYENGDVYVFSGKAGDMLQRPGPRLSEAVELFCKIFNMQAFQQLDPLDGIPKWFDDDYQYYLKYQKVRI